MVIVRPLHLESMPPQEQLNIGGVFHLLPFVFFGQHPTADVHLEEFRSVFHPGTRLTLREYRTQAERAYILSTLEEVGWNISKAATLLGVERTNLHKKMRGYGIRREDA